MAKSVRRVHDPANDVDVDADTQTLGTAYSTQVPDQSGTYVNFLPVGVHDLPADDDEAAEFRAARKGRKISGRVGLS